MPKPAPNRPSLTAIAVPVIAMGAAVLGGCASSGAPAPTANAPGVNTGLAALAEGSPKTELKATSTVRGGAAVSPDERAALVSQAMEDLKTLQTQQSQPQPVGAASATDMGSIFGDDAGPAKASSTDPGLAANRAGAVTTTPTDPAATTPTTTPATTPTTTPAPPTEAPPGVLAASDDAWSKAAPAQPAAQASGPEFAASHAEDSLTSLATKMAQLLRDPGPGGERIPDAVALAAIESVRPGVLANLESASNLLGPRLATADRRALLEARDRVLKQPDKANEALVKSLSRVAPLATLKIARGALCRRVDGFGRYDVLGTDTFQAGRPLRMIVYCELDGFASRPAQEGDPVARDTSIGEQTSVELTQSLTLYHDPSGLQAWHKPAQRVIETTRGKRRDFYLVHQVELPANLTVGRYFLKVTVTDKTSGAVDELSLPVNIVAEPGLSVRGGR